MYIHVTINLRLYYVFMTYMCVVLGVFITVYSALVHYITYI